MGTKDKILEDLNDQFLRCVSAFSKKISKISSSQQLGNTNSEFFSHFKNNSVQVKDKQHDNNNTSSISLALKFIDDELSSLYLIGVDCGYTEVELINFYAKNTFNAQITKTIAMFYYSLLQESKLTDIQAHEELILKSFLSVLNKYHLNYEETIKEICTLGTNRVALSIQHSYPLFMAMSQFDMSHDTVYKNILTTGAMADKENGTIIKSLYDLGVRFNLTDDFLLKNEITFEQLPTVLYQSKITNKIKLFLKTTQYHFTNEHTSVLHEQKIESLKTAIEYVDTLLTQEVLEHEVPSASSVVSSDKKTNKKAAKI